MAKSGKDERRREERTKNVLSSFKTFNSMIDRDEFWFQDKFEKSEWQKTGAQTLFKSNVTDGVFYPEFPIIDEYSYHKIIRHPTVALARCLMVAPMIILNWGIVEEDGAPEGAKELIEREVVSKKIQIVKQGLEGCIDYGWSCFENVYEPAKDRKTGEDYIKLSMMKNLHPVITLLRANPYTGDFVGIRQIDSLSGAFIYLPASKVQLFNFDQRGSNWYGNAMLDNCFEAVKSWEMTDRIADGYIRKIAGAHWIVWYPTGYTRYNGQDNVDNAVIAADFIEKLEANSNFAIPYDIQEWTSARNSEAGQTAWKVENFSDSGATSASYTDILRYKDTLIVRAFMMPERSILEGQFGTRAESVAQSEVAVAHMEMRLRGLVDQLNKQTVNYLLELNYGKGARDSVRIEVPPITKDDSEFIKSVYSTLLNGADTGYAVAGNIDVEAIADQLKIPKVKQPNEIQPTAQAKADDGRLGGDEAERLLPKVQD